MAQLSTLFMLAALTSYTYGRGFLNDNKKIQGYTVLILGISFFGILGILSKENAVLLPLFILIIEFTLLSSTDKSQLKGYRTFILAYLALPVLLLITYIILNKETLVLSVYDARNFSLYERLLTESRVLLDYLKLLIIPNISGIGIFHDDYTVSRNILNPINFIFNISNTSGHNFCFYCQKKASRFIIRYPMVLRGAPSGIQCFWTGTLF
jgi:hypothetical protein